MAKDTDSLTLEELSLCQRCIRFIRANPGLLQMMLGVTASEKRKVAKLADLEQKIIKILENS